MGRIRRRVLRVTRKRGGKKTAGRGRTIGPTAPRRAPHGAGEKCPAANPFHTAHRTAPDTANESTRPHQRPTTRRKGDSRTLGGRVGTPQRDSDRSLAKGTDGRASILRTRPRGIRAARCANAVPSLPMSLSGCTDKVPDNRREWVRKNRNPAHRAHPRRRWRDTTCATASRVPRLQHSRQSGVPKKVPKRSCSVGTAATTCVRRSRITADVASPDTSRGRPRSTPGGSLTDAHTPRFARSVYAPGHDGSAILAARQR
jgi:hypothetical protein